MAGVDAGVLVTCSGCGTTVMQKAMVPSSWLPPVPTPAPPKLPPPSPPRQGAPAPPANGEAPSDTGRPGRYELPVPALRPAAHLDPRRLKRRQWIWRSMPAQ